MSFRRKRWSWIAGALLVAFGLPLLRARAIRRAEREGAEARAEGAAYEARAESLSAPLGQRVVEPLACSNCGAAVPLASGAATACRHCRASVPIPGVYARLVEVRAGLREALARQVEALAAHRRARSPWIAVPMLVGVGGCYLFASLRTASSGIELAQFVAGAAGVGLVVGALGQATHDGAKLDAAVASLTARRTAGDGYACRTCGGPLATVEDGAAELCAYCGAQNLVLADTARAARRDAAHTAAVGHSVAALLADVRAARLEALRVPVQAIAAMAGVIALVGVIAMSL